MSSFQKKTCKCVPHAKGMIYFNNHKVKSKELKIGNKALVNYFNIV